MINNSELNEVRNKIDELDLELLQVLKKRFDCVKKVLEIKQQNNLPIRDLDREKQVIQSKLNLTDLPGEFVEKLYRLLIDTAVEMEEKE